MHLEELARLRQTTYVIFSQMLVYPGEERLSAVAAVAAKLQEDDGRGTAGFAFFGQWQLLLRSLAEISSRPVAEFEEEFVRVFMHSRDVPPCLPYESAYAAPEGEAAAWMMAVLEKEYAVSGLALSPTLKDLPDHVAVELEFMAFLCGAEADAWSREAVREGVESLERQATFLDRHLIRWLPEWARHVAVADGEGIYSVVADTAQAFARHDRDLTRLLLDRLGEAAKAAPTLPADDESLKRQKCRGSKCHVQ